MLDTVRHHPGAAGDLDQCCVAHDQPLPATFTEESAMAAAAMVGKSETPKLRNSNPCRIAARRHVGVCRCLPSLCRKLPADGDLTPIHGYAAVWTGLCPPAYGLGRDGDAAAQFNDDRDVRSVSGVASGGECANVAIIS
jgi:hypothetical protein